jgi:peptidyl-prolyl cis-trans isomerase B (cyclophilin B)
MPIFALVLALFQASEAASPVAEAPAPPAPVGPVVALDVAQAGESLGTITIELRKEEAPLSVANFLGYLRAGHYDGTIFHRVMLDFMIQGGGLTPEMEEKPTGAPIRNEARNQLRNSRGAVAMARTDDANSATAQFFISIRDNHSLDFGIRGAGYAVFGRVIDGMDVVDAIARTATTRRGEHQDTPTRPVVILKAREVKWVAPKPTPSPTEGAGPVAPSTEAP